MSSHNKSRARCLVLVRRLQSPPIETQKTSAVLSEAEEKTLAVFPGSAREGLQARAILDEARD